MLQRQITDSRFAPFRYGVITKCLHLHFPPLPSTHFSPSLCVVRPLTAILICGAVDDDETICGQGEAPKAMQHLLPFANSNHVGRRPNIPPPPPPCLSFYMRKQWQVKSAARVGRGERGIWGSLTPHKVFWQCETHPSMSHEVWKCLRDYSIRREGREGVRGEGGGAAWSTSCADHEHKVPPVVAVDRACHARRAYKSSVGAVSLGAFSIYLQQKQKRRNIQMYPAHISVHIHIYIYRYIHHKRAHTLGM